MADEPRRPFIAGNWKMNLNHFEAIALVQKLAFSLNEEQLTAVEVAVLRELVAAEAGRATPILFRPDHGHRMLDDLAKAVSPGYPAIGRLKGLAELRGILHALGAPPHTAHDRVEAS